MADLSHGERKQVDLLMATALLPWVLLLDEPIAGLDHLESLTMIDQFSALRQQTGLLVPEHDMKPSLPSQSSPISKTGLRLHPSQAVKPQRKR